ncbi:hypothetical protein [Nocardia sp. BMG111209]|uniref:hypothetical protein n=1 Tax=Nocardia sp. BMG111209 TaxID=1160137 RepID=UPI0003A5BE1D|nr:hypothetical protein [Nocardia sp. BMG111209]
MNIDRSKVCSYCGGPVCYIDHPIMGYGSSTPSRVNRTFQCADLCDKSRRRGGDSGHTAEKVR